MKKQSGFTLIELMIVVAIVGILAAIAIPAYQDYMIRSKVSECAASLGACKTSVAEFYGTKAYFPPTNTSAGCSTDASQYCAAATVAGSGAITVGVLTTTGTAAGCTLTLTPGSTTAGAITSWNGSNSGCNVAHIPANYR